jgi:uncharacterized protein (DUF1778 family)
MKGNAMRSARRTEKPARLNLRASMDEKHILEEAARLKQTSVSNFVLQKACEAAREVLAEEGRIRLPKTDWDAFRKALDAPPRRITTLRDLLAGPGVFDD